MTIRNSLLASGSASVLSARFTAGVFSIGGTLRGAVGFVELMIRINPLV